MAEHNLLGDKGEMLAGRFLLDKGYAVLHYNWRSGHKEIDIIARQRDVLVFVEVKNLLNYNSRCGSTRGHSNKASRAD